MFYTSEKIHAYSCLLLHELSSSIELLLKLNSTFQIQMIIPVKFSGLGHPARTKFCHR